MKLNPPVFCVPRKLLLYHVENPSPFWNPSRSSFFSPFPLLSASIADRKNVGMKHIASNSGSVPGKATMQLAIDHKWSQGMHYKYKEA